MASQETTGTRKNTLYHGTMIDLTDALDDPIDLTEEDDEPQNNTNQPPQKQANQTLLTKANQPKPQITLNDKLQVHSSKSVQSPPTTVPLLQAQTSQPLPTKATVTSQSKQIGQFIQIPTSSLQTKPTQTRSILVQKPVQKAQFDPSQGKLIQLVQKPVVKKQFDPLQAKSFQPFQKQLHLTKPTQTKSILIQKPVVQKKQFDLPQAKSFQPFPKQQVQPSILVKPLEALQAAAPNAATSTLFAEKVTTKVTDIAGSHVTNERGGVQTKTHAEIVREQLATLRKTQDKLRGKTAPHVEPIDSFEKPKTKNSVWPKFAPEADQTSHDPQPQTVVFPVEADTQAAQEMPHLPVLGPCLDTTGQYVLVPTTMLRQMMVPVGMSQSNTDSTTPSFFIMPDMMAAQPTLQPIVVQNVENQSNYIKSIVNTAPTVPSNPQEPVPTRMGPAKQIPSRMGPAKQTPNRMGPAKQIRKPQNPIRKTGQNLPMKVLSKVIRTKVDLPLQALETELPSFSQNVDTGEETSPIESSFFDLTGKDPNDEVVKHEDEEVDESIDLTDVGNDDEDRTTEEELDDPLEDTVELPDTIVLDTVTPVDIGTILKQPIRIAPSDEWCFERELPTDCLQYTMRNDRFIGFLRVECDRKSICKNTVKDLFCENLQSLWEHKKILRNLDLKAKRLRERQSVSMFVKDARGQFKKPMAPETVRRPALKETPFLPKKEPRFRYPRVNNSFAREQSFLPPKTSRSSSGESSDESEPAQERATSSVELRRTRGRPLGLKISKDGSEATRVRKRNAPSTSTSRTRKAQSLDKIKTESKKKFVFTKTEVAKSLNKKVIPRDVPVNKKVIPRDVPAKTISKPRASAKRYGDVRRKGRKSKKPPVRPSIEMMTAADNPNVEENDLFLVKKVHILNKDHNVVSLRYNPNCVEFI